MGQSFKPVVFDSSSSVPRVTVTPMIVRALPLLDTIDRVARWLPPYEPKRPALIERISHIRQRLEASQPASLAIILLRTEAKSLTNGPLRTALTRQIAKLCRLYNLTGK